MTQAPLNSLALGETAIVTKIEGNPGWQRRLAALGIVPGQPLKITGRASLGQTIALQVGLMTRVAIRPQDAAQILVTPIQNSADFTEHNLLSILNLST